MRRRINGGSIVWGTPHPGARTWLDETLATYSERIYYETVHPDQVKWWWDYRYFEFGDPGFVDTSIYDGGGQRPYWDKVYLNGARFMEDLRVRVGDEIFFAFLKDYYTQFEGKRATSADFFAYCANIPPQIFQI